MRFKIQSHKLVALLVTLMFVTNVFSVAFGATSVNYPVEVTDGTYTFRFATHTGNADEGNWIQLSGGTAITLPTITLYYNGILSADYDKGGNNVVVNADGSIKGTTITYPYTTHPLYAPTDQIDYTFKGDSDFATFNVDAKLIKVDDPLDFEQAASDAFNGDTSALRAILDGTDPNNIVVETDALVLDGNGDVSADFGTQSAGDYIVVIMDKVANTYILYSATFVEVLDKSLTSTLSNTEVDEGDDLDIEMTLSSAGPGGHVYGAIMIKESAYHANAQLISQGTTDNSEVTVNGATLMDGSGGSFSLFAGGFGGFDEGAIMDFMGDAFASDEWAAVFSSSADATNTLSVDTNGLDEDDYVVLTGVWDSSADISNGARLLGFDQDTVYVDNPVFAAAIIGGTTTTPTQDEFDEQSTEEKAETITSLETEDAVDLIEGSSTEDAAQVLEKLDDEDAATLIEAMDETKATEIIDAMQTEAASNLINQTSTEKATAILIKTNTTKATQIIEKLETNKTRDVVQEAVSKGNTSSVASILNTANKETVGDVLLAVEPETGAKVIREMATQDLNSAAERVETAVKRQINELEPGKKQEYRRKLKETIENPELSVDDLVNLFTEIANLPETPSTVAEIFEIIDLSKTVEVVDGMVAKDKESETALVFSYLSTEKLTEIYSALSAATRTAIYPYFDAETLGNLPQLGEFTVTSLSVSAETVEPGESVTVTALVENIGDEADSTTITFSVDGSEIESQILTLDAGGTETLTWTISKAAEGTYTVEVMGETASFTVQAPPTPAEFTLSNLQVSPSTVEPGEDVTVSFTVMNSGEESGDYSVDVMLDGATVDTLTGTLDGGDSESLTATVSSDAEGTHTVAVDGLDADFSVEVPPSGFPWTYAAYIYMQQQKQ